MKRLNLLIILSLATSFATVESVEIRKRPRLTVIMVIDQFAYHYIPKLYPHLRGGLRFLLNHGIVYENAYFPLSNPSTGPSHTSLNTGTLPKDHGIIGNSWNAPDGSKINCDMDSVEYAAVLAPDGDVYDYGKGPYQIMVDGITDQFMLREGPCARRESYSISLKSCAAICTANKMGKAIWFDEQSGNFTSSLAYFDELPCWLKNFNNQQRVNQISQVTWRLAYPCKKRPYCFKNINNYQYSLRPEGLAGKTVRVGGSKNPFELYVRTPAANKLLFDCALSCINAHMSRKCDTEMLLWISLSPLDFIGHDYGPDSLEAIDMIYHLDCQIKQFMDCINARLKRTETLYVLTADHGVSPIPELLEDQGFTNAQRIVYDDIAKELNASAQKDFGVAGALTNTQSALLFVNKQQLQKLPAEKQSEALASLQKQLLSHSGIKRVWTYKELEKACFEPDTIEAFYQNQIFPGRSSQLIVQTFPYAIPTDFNKGTGHYTPYEYDTHVPLILYQKRALESREIHEKVWTLQLANTLAYLLDIPKPSASTYNILPGIFDYDPITGELIQTVAV
jgi:hypothetical protein